MYRERMNGYYPNVIQSILEFQAIINSEAPEFEDMSIAKKQITSDAYLLTMGEERIEEWEELLGIKAIEGSSVDDRRETIIARIRGQGKLNRNLINTIVNTFTGGTANSWVEDSVLYIEVTPPPGNKTYRFENVKQELAKKVPAHLGLNIYRNYGEWGEILNNHPTWQDVRDSFATWNDVYIFNPLV